MLTPTVTEISRLSAHPGDLPALNLPPAGSARSRALGRKPQGRRFRTVTGNGRLRVEQVQRVR